MGKRDETFKRGLQKIIVTGGAGWVPKHNHWYGRGIGSRLRRPRTKLSPDRSIPARLST